MSPRSQATAQRQILVLFFSVMVFGLHVWAGGPTFDPVAVAATHPMVRERPGPTFFTGALLGNGGLGAVVCTRPDGVAIHFGHNDVWDQRIALENLEGLGTFQEFFEKLRAIPEDTARVGDVPWYEDYRLRARQNYSESYPRPFPCGTLVLGFDPRHVEMLGRRVDIANGLCRIDLLADGKHVVVEVFVEMGPDRLWIRLIDDQGQPAPSVFDRIRLLEDPNTPKEIPSSTGLVDLPDNALGFRQVLPYRPPHADDAGDPHPNDRAFSLAVRSSADLVDATWPTTEGTRRASFAFERAVSGREGFYTVVQLDHDLDTVLSRTTSSMPEPNAASFENACAATGDVWASYWRKCGVRFPQSAGNTPVFLEEIWYWNLYFFNCAARPESAWPGLFANWSYGDIGTAWHGDYHLDYNVQQLTWLAFSSNHVDKHMAYVNVLRDYWLPVGRDWAKRFYGMRGAFFPVTLYPIEMQINPYPVPPWGFMICCTPWAVQSLWWHYEYTRDKAFLRDQAFDPIRETVLFLVDYITRPGAYRGEDDRDTYHVFPSAVPELYGFVPGLKYNEDPLSDLALITFVFNAYLQAVEVLGVEASEAQTAASVRGILARFPEDPVAKSRFGDVYVNVIDEDPDVVQNVPASMMHVFPGEQYGMDAPPEVLDKLMATWHNLRTEGGNDIVFRNIIGARLGLLDLNAFARELRYDLTDNGSLSDRVLQVHGRYSDTTDFDYMDEMGVWAENFAAPAVINECLMQSWNQEIRLFPNWPEAWDAEFSGLRAKGAFLVSAQQRDGTVEWAEITSEAGGLLRLRNPWPDGARVTIDEKSRTLKDERIEIETQPHETIRLIPAEE